MSGGKVHILITQRGGWHVPQDDRTLLELQVPVSLRAMTCWFYSALPYRSVYHLFGHQKLVFIKPSLYAFWLHLWEVTT